MNSYYLSKLTILFPSHHEAMMLRALALPHYSAVNHSAAMSEALLGSKCREPSLVVSKIAQSPFHISLDLNFSLYG
jgi:hypothetical protein